ncbi:receptor-like protein 14 [Papaver somniferum]|uniref:receptor-like protein 14 n=1 Tax=Papaver somniferum TaxID=3469 RepID=UPI000E6FD66F|nr:receptor-like protein 14 [Papaver somniferum]
MSKLESLDLSFNILSGHIPQSLTSIDSLGFLSLSHNNLSGKIPRGNHFDTLSLEGSAFVGNEFLCGFPTEKDCEGKHSIGIDKTNPSSETDNDDKEDAKQKLLLYAIVSLGFGVGFWSLFLVLLLNKQKWWFPYWRIVDSVAVAINASSFLLNYDLIVIVAFDIRKECEASLSLISSLMASCRKIKDWMYM